jgi:hypothetical protein
MVLSTWCHLQQTHFHPLNSLFNPSMKIRVFWDMMVRCWASSSKYFDETSFIFKSEDVSEAYAGTQQMSYFATHFTLMQSITNSVTYLHHPYSTSRHYNRGLHIIILHEFLTFLVTSTCPPINISII